MEGKSYIFLRRKPRGFIQKIALTLFGGLLSLSVLAQGPGCGDPICHMMEYSGGTYGSTSDVYATGNCFEGLSPGTYCFDYTYPSSGGEMQFNVLQVHYGSGSCPSGGNSYHCWAGPSFSNADNSGCGGWGTCNTWATNYGCTELKDGGFEVGLGCGGGHYNKGDVYQICVTIPSTCDSGDICPMLYCESGECNTEPEGTAGDCYSPLPVEMTDLQASSEPGDRISIEWRTATETNNDYFVVQQSYNGEDFENIGKVEGAGTSSKPHDYNYTVKYTGSDSVLYYRLLQTDYNGRANVHGPVSVELKEGGAQGLGVDVQPNPAEGKRLSFDIKASHSGVVQLEVLTMTGSVVHTRSFEQEAGSDRLHEDLSDLEPGYYLLRLRNEYDVSTSRFVLGR